MSTIRPLSRYIRLVIFLNASFSLGVHHAYAAHDPEKWGRGFECKERGTQAPEACRALELYKNGVVPEETPLGGVRIVDVGYLANAAGAPTHQLVVLELSWSRDFHQKVYFPNKICAFFVRYGNEGEKSAIDSAIQELRAHKTPVGNPAYEWGMDHDISLKQCRSLAMNEEGTALVSETGNWSVTSANGYYIFVAKSWGKNKADLVLLHRYDE